MKRLFALGALAAAGLLSSASPARAWDNPAWGNYGYGPLGAFAMRCGGWIHFHGPLYNYGPYCLTDPGYVQMHIPKPYHGQVAVADPVLWSFPYGNYQPAYGYESIPPTNISQLYGTKGQGQMIGYGPGYTRYGYGGGFDYVGKEGAAPVAAGPAPGAPLVRGKTAAPSSAVYPEWLTAAPR